MKAFNRKFFVNFALVTFIILVTFVVMMLSFASKAARYDQTANTVPLQVQKGEYQVSAQTIGTVSNVLVQPGQHVTKGQELVVLSNEVLDNQIAQLQKLASTDASADVELVDLETQKAAQQIYAPTDGIVSSIMNDGEPVNTLQNVATIYSDDSVNLVGRFSLSNYDAVQQNSDDLSVSDARLQTNYPVQYAGVREVVSTQNNPNGDVTLVFAFDNSQDATTLLENEQVLLQLVPPQSSTKPVDEFVDWYKTHIEGISASQ
jgi:biotin carboxyl carrier protein